MANRNYHAEMEEILHSGNRPRVLLHVCCAPCSTVCLERLVPYADVTLLYTNSNIYPPSEYLHRLTELRCLVQRMPETRDVPILMSEYDPARFFSLTKGLANEPERGERCRRCIRYRLEQTAVRVLISGAEYFTTTLTVSPHKDVDFINRCGEELARKYDVKWLPSDFKKQDGFRRSTELSRQYGLYRQNFCGCVFSQRNAESIP